MKVRRIAIRSRFRMDPTLFIKHRHTFFSFCILFIDFRDLIDNMTLVSRFTVGAFLENKKGNSEKWNIKIGTLDLLLNFTNPLGTRAVYTVYIIYTTQAEHTLINTGYIYTWGPVLVRSRKTKHTYIINYIPEHVVLYI